MFNFLKKHYFDFFCKHHWILFAKTNGTANLNVIFKPATVEIEFSYCDHCDKIKIEKNISIAREYEDDTKIIEKDIFLNKYQTYLVEAYHNTKLLNDKKKMLSKLDLN